MPVIYSFPVCHSSIKSKPFHEGQGSFLFLHGILRTNLWTICLYLVNHNRKVDLIYLLIRLAEALPCPIRLQQTTGESAQTGCSVCFQFASVARDESILLSQIPRRIDKDRGLAQSSNKYYSANFNRKDLILYSLGADNFLLEFFSLFFDCVYISWNHYFFLVIFFSLFCWSLSFHRRGSGSP